MSAAESTPPTDVGQAGSAPIAKPPYPSAAALSTQIGPEGIRFDFNSGACVLPPRRDPGSWRVRLRDLDTGNILVESENAGAFVASSKRWDVRFSVEVWALDDGWPAREVMRHEHDPRGRDVLIQFPIGTLGDILAWFPYAARFADVHAGTRVTCALSGLIVTLLRDAYPGLTLVTHEEVIDRRLADSAYATCSIGLFFEDAACDWQPTRSRARAGGSEARRPPRVRFGAPAKSDATSWLGRLQPFSGAVTRRAQEPRAGDGLIEGDILSRAIGARPT